jgi:hypothetical protein
MLARGRSRKTIRRLIGSSANQRNFARRRLLATPRIRHTMYTLQLRRGPDDRSICTTRHHTFSLCAPSSQRSSLRTQRLGCELELLDGLTGRLTSRPCLVTENVPFSRSALAAALFGRSTWTATMEIIAGQQQARRNFRVEPETLASFNEDFLRGPAISITSASD